MKLWLRRLFKGALAVLVLLYAIGATFLALKDDALPDYLGARAELQSVVIFGASGTTGDGILKASLADTGIEKIHVITRRLTPRIEEGVAQGKVQVTLHQDYLNYSAIEAQIADIDTVFWAIGISSVGVDEKTYGMIHVDFPARFLETWLPLTEGRETSFHFISSSDISEESDTMWIREKIRAEKTLFGLAEGTGLKVIAYRPDYIGPTKEEAHLGQNLLYWFFAPVGAAVKARDIGQSMIEVSSRIDSFDNGAKLPTRKIVLHSDAYEKRHGLAN